MRKLSIILILLLIVLFVLFLLFFPFGGKKEKKETKIIQEAEIVQEEGGGEEVERKLKIMNFSTFFPVRSKEYYLPELREKSGIAILFTNQGKEEILYQKNIGERIPIASLTKLMSAMVVMDNCPLDQEIEVSREAVLTLGESGRLSPGEKISIKGLLDLALLVSSNDAASALAEIIGKEKFIDLMNKKTEEVGLKNTHFMNSHGLDEKNHYSTASDLALLIQYSIVHYPEIWEVLGTKEKDVIGKDNLGREILHHCRNTNKLLSEKGVLGGKTGYTEDAGDCMILAMEAPGKVRGNIAVVILGVSFGERIPKAKQLYDWIRSAYVWE